MTDPREVRRLEAEIERLRSALEKIANADYRGNMPTAMQIAREALGW